LAEGAKGMKAVLAIPPCGKTIVDVVLEPPDMRQ
jgi:hypothetical protein